MGSENSRFRNENVSTSNEHVSVSMALNNLPPLLFHPVHGENIKLFKNGAQAFRTEGFCKGIVFSNRPVMVHEYIRVKFIDISSNWSGALRIGFTQHDPYTVSSLPNYACPQLTSRQGNWLKAIAEGSARKNSVLIYYVDQSGDVYYGFDSKEPTILFGGVNTAAKLWAVIDIYGNTIAIELISRCSSTAQNNSNRALGGSGYLKSIESFSITSMFFHSIHGLNISLEASRSLARRKSNAYRSAYAFTERPLQLEENLVVIVERNNICSPKSFTYGITTCDPSTIMPPELPANNYDLMDRREYWVFEDICDIDENETVVFTLTEGKVNVTTDATKKDPLHVDTSHPLWFFFDLNGAGAELLLIGTYFNKSSQASDALTNNDGGPTTTISSSPTPVACITNKCIICFEELVNCALYRCGHTCMCYSCATKIWHPDSTDAQCPMCRQVIEDVIKIYV